MGWSIENIRPQPDKIFENEGELVPVNTESRDALLRGRYA